MNKASRRTRENLKGVNHKLIAVVGYALAISEVDFWVNEGLRTTEKQQEYFKTGASQLDGINKKSNHQLGRAVDVYYTGWTNKDKPNDPRWEKIYEAFRIASKMLNVKIVFGKDWKSLVDRPHIELAKGE
ncbi:M15 family metallopeptidase [uncultured Fusobacterium sp.]|uniref:M15 family metallopeptidase n=1 Tax=uncultured Fusobacterium sp. TaxID=159267 RepID=UPI002804065A|nr:M15 family metallopeptidase [uncultured Fusobacterium sp.]